MGKLWRRTGLDAAAIEKRESEILQWPWEAAAFKDHLSYLPFSGSVLDQLADELRGYTVTKSALHFPVDRPLPTSLVKRLIAVRLDQIGRASP